MKTMITALAAAGALLLTATPAQAAPKDPVRALKAQFATGHGVRFTEATRHCKTSVQTRKGTFQFDKKGLAASDITASIAGLKERSITIGKTTYISGGMLNKLSSGGKTWLQVRNMPGGTSGMYGQVINPAEPKTLAALVKRSKHTGNRYTGTITFKELGKLSPWFKASFLLVKENSKVSYTFTVNSAGLVNRVTSSYKGSGVLDTAAQAGKTTTIDTRFTGWGAKVSIKAPNPDDVTVASD
jgi:hypothetical protein